MVTHKKNYIILLLIIVILIVSIILLYNENTSSYIKYNELSKNYKIIIDRNNDILVNTTKKYSLYIIPNRINNFEKIVDILVNKLGLNKTEIQNKIINSNSIILIKDELDEHEINELKKLKLNCLLLIEYEKRINQYKNFALDILGIDSNNKLLDGIEYFYINDSNSKIDRDTYNDSLRLTIDKTIQMTLENNLQKLQLKHDSNLSVIIMSTNTGEILSLYNMPQTKINKENNIIIKYPNYAISDLYKPIPIFFLVNTLIENHNKIEYQINIFDKLKSVKINHIKISTDEFYHNLEIDQKRNKILNLLIHLGFGQKTGIDLPFENTGYFHQNVDFNDNFLYATPIQILVAYNTIINKGKLVKPIINLNSFDTNNIINLNFINIDWSNTNNITKNFSENKFLFISDEKINNDENQIIILGHYPKDNPKVSFILTAKNLELDILFSNNIHNLIFDLLYIASRIKFINTEQNQLVNHQIKNGINNDIMPNLLGLPLRTAINLLSGSCKIKIEGEGYIFSQIPQPGSKLEQNMTCKLVLSN